MGNKAIQIVLANGDVREWEASQYTDYTIEGGLFIVIFNEQWVGMYDMSQIVSVEIR